MATQKQAGSEKASANFLLFQGEDEYRVKAAARAKVDALCPPADQAFGLELINGTVDNAEGAVLALRRCLGALCTPGFLGGRKVVWLQDANFFADTGNIKGDALKDARDGFAQELKKGIGEDFILVISAGKVDGRTAFAKVCKEIAVAESFIVPERSRQQEAPASEWAGECFRKAGLRLSGDVLHEFLDRAGYDTRQIVTEVEKLSIYLGARKEVTAEDIQMLVAPARKSENWDLPDAVGQRQLPQALDILRQLLFQGENAVVLVIALENRWRELEIIRGSLDAGWLRASRSGTFFSAQWSGGSAAEAAKNLLTTKEGRAMHPFRLGKLAVEQATKFLVAELRRNLAETLAIHEQMVSGSGAPEILLELLLVKLLRKPAA